MSHLSPEDGVACHAPDRTGGHSYARDHDAALHGQRDRQRQIVRHAVSRDGYMRPSAKEMCERGGGRPGPPSLIVRTVSVDYSNTKERMQRRDIQGAV